VDRVLDKARFWQAHSDKGFNERQEQAINTMFSMNPKDFRMTPKKYMGITRCSKATATRDIAELRKRECLTQEGKGRSIRYSLSIPCHPMKVR
jgi:Fic family protein